MARQLSESDACFAVSQADRAWSGQNQSDVADSLIYALTDANRMRPCHQNCLGLVRMPQAHKSYLLHINAGDYMALPVISHLGFLMLMLLVHLLYNRSKAAGLPFHCQTDASPS